MHTLDEYNNSDDAGSLCPMQSMQEIYIARPTQEGLRRFFLDTIEPLSSAGFKPKSRETTIIGCKDIGFPSKELEDKISSEDHEKYVKFLQENKARITQSSVHRMTKTKKKLLKPVIEDDILEGVDEHYKSVFTKVHKSMKKMKFDTENTRIKSVKFLEDLISQVYWMKSGRSLESWY